jgi:N-acetylglutamate synthase
MTPEDLLAAEIALRDAWPAAEAVGLGGWRLRAMSGGYNRTNSVWPGAFSGSMPLERAIEQAEAFYTERGLRPCFQVLDSARPHGLDAALAARGYLQDRRCVLMAKTVQLVATSPDTVISADATDDWLSVYLSDQDAVRAGECPRIFAGLPPARAFLVHRVDGEPAAVAMVANTARVAAVECVVTRADLRRKGAAAAVMRSAEWWADTQGAARIVLAVIGDNTAAVALYTGLGYQAVSGYNYRVKPA